MNLHPVHIRLARRGLIAFCTLFALLTLLGFQALPVSAAAPPSYIRLINASPDVGTVDVFVDGHRFLENASFASVTGYLQFPSGSHKVALAAIGKGTRAAALTQKLSVKPGDAYTVAATGTKATGISLQVFTDDNRMVNGKATVRVYDLSPGSGALNVTSGATTLIGPVSYRQASIYQNLAAGQYMFTFSSSQPAFTLFDQVALKTDTVTSFFLIGVLHGIPPLQVFHIQVKGLPRLLAGTGSDPNPLPLQTSRVAPATTLPWGALALVGLAVVLFACSWLFSRQKGNSRLRPGRLFSAALGIILALSLSLGGLSLAFFMSHQAPAPTARLLIPAIGVNTSIESVGVLPNGTMDTPRQNPWSDVGLYTGGPQPGDRGSAVIAGHLDRPGGNPAVFWLLRDLQVNDEVQFVTAQGKILLFHVTRIAAYPLQDPPVQDIFGNNTGRFLNLTTCAGDWIPSEHSRTMRLVIYTAFGPAPTTPSLVTSATLLSWSSLHSNVTSSTAPSSPSNVSPPTVVSSSPSSSTSRTTASSSHSSLVSTVRTTAQAPLPAVIRQKVEIWLPGISLKSTGIVRKVVNQGKINSVLSQPTSAVRRTITRVVQPLLSNVLHQVNRKVTHIPVVGKVLHQVNRQLKHIPVVNKVLHQVNQQMAHTPVVGKVLHQVTHTSVVGKPLHLVNKHLAHTPVVGKVVHQVNQPVTHTQVVSKPLHQVSKHLTHTPVVSKPLQRTSKRLTHTSVVSKLPLKIKK